MKRSLFLGVIPILLLSVSCSHSSQEQPLTQVSKVNADYVSSVDSWHKEREADLRKDNSWLALSGLFWLTSGDNSFGSSEENNVVFPAGKIAPRAGTFILDGADVLMKLADGVEANIDGEPVKNESAIYSAQTNQSAVVNHGALSWLAIKRGDKYGIRLWDAESEARKAFKGIERYPVQENWKLKARLEKNPLPKRIAITNVLGQTSYEPSLGAVVFNLDGKEYRLDALEEGDELFIIFGDRTNGAETYGSGRYLYIPKPGADGKTEIDFNKAYNPPCAFTDFATCPLPPKQNLLPLNILAGEKNYDAKH